ncbi:hypothetical protein ABVK25_008397 [Lepraria finkii]|uniref:Sde2 ubiquitin domain-containing protein n=1 Tax=Lepraria finkii TaxID=1340010 RepID=A0ABR4B1A3_9LECA
MLLKRIPSMVVDASLILTTFSNRKLEPDSILPLASFLDQESNLLPIRLSALLVRGKDFPDDHPVNDANNAAADASAAQLDHNAAGAPEPPAEDNDSVAGNAGSDAGWESRR